MTFHNPERKREMMTSPATATPTPDRPPVDKIATQCEAFSRWIQRQFRNQEGEHPFVLHIPPQVQARIDVDLLVRDFAAGCDIKPAHIIDGYVQLTEALLLDPTPRTIAIRDGDRALKEMAKFFAMKCDIHAFVILIAKTDPTLIVETLSPEIQKKYWQVFEALRWQFPL